ncbi:hypothetical protein BH24ACT9_BH24ACT9_14130 [soil metagenome]
MIDTMKATRTSVGDQPIRRAIPEQTPAMTLLEVSRARMVLAMGTPLSSDGKTCALKPRLDLVHVEAVSNDITTETVDAVVNAANPGLLGGGGVDGAIHAAGGPEILAECRKLKSDLPGGLLSRGQAVATTAGRLPARWVIHTAGPVYEPTRDRSAILRSCYVESLRLASRLGAASVAFPAISTGVYGWPMDDAARLAVSAVRSTSAPGIELVRFALFGQPALQAFRAALLDSGTP